MDKVVAIVLQTTRQTNELTRGNCRCNSLLITSIQNTENGLQREGIKRERRKKIIGIESDGNK